MATGPGANLGKTAFAEQFLVSNPEADLDAVNEAWTSAGNDGTVSESLFSKTRSRLKREGKLEAEPAPAPKGKAKPSRGPKAKPEPEPEPEPEDLAPPEPQAQDGGEGPSKSDFVVEALARDPKVNVREVNRLWSEAGHEGKISDSIFYKVKREHGQSGDSAADEPSPSGGAESGVSDAGGAAAPQSSGAEESEPVAASGGESEGPGRVVDEVEAGIDDLMYTLKASGGMPEVEAALRAARRLLVRGQED